LDIRVDGQIPGTVEYAPITPAASAAPAPAPQTAVPTANWAPAPPATAPPMTAPPATAPPATAPPATAPPATAPPATAPRVTELPAAAPVATVPASTAGDSAKPAPSARILLNPSQMQTSLSSPVAVAVVIEGGQDVATAPMVIRYDPKMLRLNDATAGDFLAAGGQTPVLTKNIQNDTGTATVAIHRPPGQPGVSGASGVLVNLNFQAVGRGSATVTISHIAVRNSQGQIVAEGNPEMTLKIQ